jgi:hypothetical protein
MDFFTTLLVLMVAYDKESGGVIEGMKRERNSLPFHDIILAIIKMCNIYQLHMFEYSVRFATVL